MKQKAFTKGTSIALESYKIALHGTLAVALKILNKYCQYHYLVDYSEQNDNSLACVLGTTQETLHNILISCELAQYNGEKFQMNSSMERPNYSWTHFLTEYGFHTYFGKMHYSAIDGHKGKNHFWIQLGKQKAGDLTSDNPCSQFEKYNKPPRLTQTTRIELQKCFAFSTSILELIHELKEREENENGIDTLNVEREQNNS